MWFLRNNKIEEYSKYYLRVENNLSKLQYNSGVVELSPTRTRTFILSEIIPV